MKPIGSLFLPCLFIGFLLTHCGPSPEATSQPKRFGRLDYDIGQCERTPFEGSELKAPISTGAPQPLVFFGKNLFLDGLERTLSASSYSIAKRLFIEGVSLFHVKSSNHEELSCRYFDFLPEVSGVAQSQWESLSKPKNQNDTLLGLFTTIYSKNSQSKKTRLKNPNIMVLDRTQKWTLLHEMSHYLYAKARTFETDLQLSSHLDESVEKTHHNIQHLRKQLVTSAKEKTAQHLISSYQRFFEINFELDKRSALEEFAVEALLLDYNRQQKITGVNQINDAYQAFLYMKSNGEKVAFSYILFLDALKELKSLMQENSWNTSVAPLLSLIDRIQGEIDFIDQELETAKTFFIDKSAIKHLVRTNLDIRPHYDVKKFDRRHQWLRSK